MTLFEIALKNKGFRTMLGLYLKDLGDEPPERKTLLSFAKDFDAEHGTDFWTGLKKFKHSDVDLLIDAYRHSAKTKNPAEVPPPTVAQNPKPASQARVPKVIPFRPADPTPAKNPPAVEQEGIGTGEDDLPDWLRELEVDEEPETPVVPVPQPIRRVPISNQPVRRVTQAHPPAPPPIVRRESPRVNGASRLPEALMGRLSGLGKKQVMFLAGGVVIFVALIMGGLFIGGSLGDFGLPNLDDIQLPVTQPTPALPNVTPNPRPTTNATPIPGSRTGVGPRTIPPTAVSAPNAVAVPTYTTWYQWEFRLSKGSLYDYMKRCGISTEDEAHSRLQKLKDSGWSVNTIPIPPCQ